MDRELVAFAVFGALLGGFLGGSIAAILPERALRLIFVPRGCKWRGMNCFSSLFFLFLGKSLLEGFVVKFFF